jgi:CHAT domain-containing protein
MGSLLQVMGEHGKALPYYERALAMTERLYPEKDYPRGHPHLARSLHSMGFLLEAMGERGKALPYYERALAMYERLYPEKDSPRGDPELAQSLNNLGFLLQEMGEHGKARPYYERALAMHERLYPEKDFPRGHPALARSLHNLGALLRAMEKYDEALPPLKRALAMYQGLAETYAAGAGSAQAAAFVRSLPLTRNVFLSASRHVRGSDASAFDLLWPSRALVTRVFEARHESVRLAVRRSETARQKLADLNDVRRQLQALLLSPPELNADRRAARDRRLRELSDRRDQLERDLLPFLPEIERRKELAKLGPADLAKKLPADAVFLDFLHYGYYGKDKEPVYYYVAFVVAPGRPVKRVELGEAAPLDEAVAAWRKAIDKREASAAPSVLRRRLWDKVAEHLPKGTRTVYLAAEGDLARLPFAALPGSTPGTVLLEDFPGGIAVVPHGAYLLEQLLYPPKYPDGPASFLAVGDVRYDPPGAEAGKPWPPLPGTAVELQGVRALAGKRALPPLTGPDATAARLLDELPKARYAHLATHGFFDEQALQAEREWAREQLKQWKYSDAAVTYPVGTGGRSPLAYVGVVLAGANAPDKAGKEGGVVTGEALLDVPLEGLRLCVLSACDTGLGDEAGEGVAGLQRAFHLAGCANVVASLWRVDDAATAALMAKFYHELWVNNKPPLEALREAQLTIYRRPELVPALAGERGKPRFDEAVKLPSEPPKSPEGNRAKTADTKQWAAFVLSGIGTK